MWVGELLRRIRYLLFRDRYTAELEEEIRLHIELRAARLQERGISVGAARYAARRRFGNTTTLQERSRDMWGWNMLADVIADVRFAARRLCRRPGLSVPAITIAALGIGATAAVFSAIDAAILRPLPFANPEALLMLPNVSVPFDPGAQRFPQGRHLLDITDIEAMRDVFGASGAFAAGGLNLVDPVNPQRVRVGVVTTGFFATLGATPQRGRVFDSAEGRPRGPHSVILSDALWHKRFGGNDVVGKSIDLSGTRYTVVGIMKPGFDFPDESDLWIPLTVPTTFETFAPFRGFLPSRVIARAAPGVDVATASARLLANWTRLMGRPENGTHSNLDDMVDKLRVSGAAIPLQRELLGDRRRGLVILMGATALLLLIACANVANLLLSDGAARRREVALREMLGASRSRIARQLVVESVLLALSGAAAGIALAPTVLGLLRATMPADLAGVATAQLDVRVLAFAAVLAIVTGLLFGLLPALFSTRTDASEALKSGGALGATAGRLGHARRVLITAELALTVMLLIGSGLMLRSLKRVLSQDMGMDPDRVGTLELSLGPGSRASRLAKLHAILDRLERDPAIQASAIVNDLPLRGGGGISLSIEVDGVSKARSVDEMKFSRYLVASGGYFQALRIPILRGRTFGAAQDSAAPPVALISAAMAAKWWPNADALGKTFHFGIDTTPITVIGIVADVRESSLEGNVRPQMYFSIDRGQPDNVAVLARGALPPGALLARLTDAVHAADRTQAVYNVRMMDAVVSKSIAPRRTNTTLIALFGAVALVLSAFGVYAVVSYSVTSRTREFGIRAALGARGLDIAALVGREMVATVLVGVALGLGGGWALTRLMTALLFQIDAHDATTFLMVPLVLVMSAAIATLIPARRAMALNPSDVMRAE